MIKHFSCKNTSYKETAPRFASPAVPPPPGSVGDTVGSSRSLPIGGNTFSVEVLLLKGATKVPPYAFGRRGSQERPRSGLCSSPGERDVPCMGLQRTHSLLANKGVFWGLPRSSEHAGCRTGGRLQKRKGTNCTVQSLNGLPREGEGTITVSVTGKLQTHPPLRTSHTHTAEPSWNPTRGAPIPLVSGRVALL